MTEILQIAREDGVDLIGSPRLVRLNPNIPFKTRGNAALSARFGRGRGRRRRIGVIDGRPIWSFATGDALPARQKAGFLDDAWATVLRSSRLEDKGTDPALVSADQRLPAALYWSAVHRKVSLVEVRRILSDAGASCRTHDSARGIVGAASAISWPGGHPTWELIAYRSPHRYGSRRAVDAQSVRAARERYPELFLCYDSVTRRLMVSPHTACPILYGLRSTDPSILPGASAMIGSEPVDRWIVFQTNQGTGDHLRSSSFEELAPYSAGSIVGSVEGPALTLPGGHVRFQFRDGSGTRGTCLVFEPTKVLARVAAQLRDGDRLRVWGGRGRDANFRVEGLVVGHVNERSIPRRPPRCTVCGTSAHSLGFGRGYRCRRCRRRWPPEAATALRAPRGISRGEFHPTPSARRHLAPRGPENDLNGPVP